MKVSNETFAAYFSCFSDHPVDFKGVSYRTAEHAYHAQRYDDETIREEIRNAPTARDAWAISQTYKDQQRAEFPSEKCSVMKEILRAKLAQHEDVQTALQETKDLEIVKEEPLDPYWGTGPDGNGANVLGKLWMELRLEMEKV